MFWSMMTLTTIGETPAPETDLVSYHGNTITTKMEAASNICGHRSMAELANDILSPFSGKRSGRRPLEPRMVCR
jgi:hypothetical protein